MFRMLIRVLFGFVIACLAAALAQVLFVITPDELVGLPAEALSNRMGQVGILTLLSATHFAIFAAPFALVAAALGEWWSLRSWAFYVLAGLAIALGGFVAQLASEVEGQATIVNNYALRAFLVTGVVGGLTYWLFAGRGAGGPVEPDTIEVDYTRPTRPLKPEAPPSAGTPKEQPVAPTKKVAPASTAATAESGSSGVPSVAKKGAG